ncbi:MAG: 23S rRNA (pseudouridine(1915)-N(3))-methyltransferase RlmH [Acidobacteriota bacterium]
MRLKIVWPGKTKNREWRALQEFYLERIRRLEPCALVEPAAAKGLEDRFADKIKEIEAKNLEKHLADNYIICLFDRGKEMTFSHELCRVALLEQIYRALTIRSGKHYAK